MRGGVGVATSGWSSVGAGVGVWRGGAVPTLVRRGAEEWMMSLNAEEAELALLGSSEPKCAGLDRGSARRPSQAQRADSARPVCLVGRAQLALSFDEPELSPKACSARPL